MIGCLLSGYKIMREDLAVGVIGAYLMENIRGSSVTHEGELADEIRIAVVTSERTLHLKVEKKFFEERDEARLKADLEEYNLAEVLVQLGGFTVLLSNSGCVFDPY